MAPKGGKDVSFTPVQVKAGHKSFLLNTDMCSSCILNLFVVLMLGQKKQGGKTHKSEADIYSNLNIERN